MERTPHDTHHTVDPSWPFALGVNEFGQSVNTCADCGAELPDGCLAERIETGLVVAWTPAGTDVEGKPIRNVIHECAGLTSG